MLAVLGEAFESAEHLYEVKWDGIRAVASVEGGAHRLASRNRLDLTPRYPELEFLAGLPPGLVLDGELVVLRDGRPDFHLSLQRVQARGGPRARALAARHPASYVVFDLLHRDFEPLLREPLSARRERLAEVVAAVGDPRLVLSEGIVGGEGRGAAFFEHVQALGLEGMVVKRLASTYQPGRRTTAWTKVKVRSLLHCAILGFVEDADGLKSLILASDDPDDGGRLACVGKVGGGWSEAQRARLGELLRARVADAPLVPCEERGTWVEPGLYCTVSYLERTPHGGLRAPVFVELITP